MKRKLIVILGKNSHSLYFRGFDIGYKWKNNTLTLPYTKKFDRVISIMLKILHLLCDVRIIVLMPNYSCDFPANAKVLVINHESGHLHTPPTEGIDNNLLSKIYKCLKSSSCIVYPTNETRREHLYFEPEFKDKKWMILPHQFDRKKIVKPELVPSNMNIDIISIGTTQNRKNWAGFFEILMLVNRPKIVHVIVPTNFKVLYESEIFKIEEKGHEIVIHNGIDEAKKNHLLKQSKYYLQVSTYEGFCVPVFEALYFNCTVLAMKTKIMSEAHSDFNIFYDYYHDIAECINLDKKVIHNNEKISHFYCDIDNYKSKLINTVREL